jgi:hypothetical protein
LRLAAVSVVLYGALSAVLAAMVALLGGTA